MPNPTTPLPVQEPAGAVEAKPSYMTWNLHPRTAELVHRFSYALAGKLAAAEKKYGFSDGWADPDWMDECREKLLDHIDKGDPRDVAAYCAFLWHHGASTAPSKPSMKTIADLAEVFDEGVRQGASLAPLASLPPVTQAKSEAVAWRFRVDGHDAWMHAGDKVGGALAIQAAGGRVTFCEPLYAAPQEAVERQPLTREQIEAIDDEVMKSPRDYCMKFARAIETAHGIGPATHGATREAQALASAYAEDAWRLNAMQERRLTLEEWMGRGGVIGWRVTAFSSNEAIRVELAFGETPRAAIDAALAGASGAQT